MNWYAGKRRRARTLCAVAATATAVLTMSAAGAARGNVLANPGFETPDVSAGDAYATTGNSSWNGFGAGAFITTVTKQSGNQAFKTFGSPGGAFQDFAAAPGQTWEGTVFGEKLSSDPMTGTQAGFVNIEWHDSGGNTISFLSTKVVDATSVADQWIQGTVNGVAPAGTTTARLVLLGGPYNGAGAGGGATFFDNATFEQVTSVPEPASLAALALAGALALRRPRRA